MTVPFHSCITKLSERAREEEIKRNEEELARQIGLSDRYRKMRERERERESVCVKKRLKGKERDRK